MGIGIKTRNDAHLELNSAGGIKSDDMSGCQVLSNPGVVVDIEKHRKIREKRQGYQNIGNSCKTNGNRNDDQGQRLVYTTS